MTDNDTKVTASKRWQDDAGRAADITLDALFRRASRIFADRTAITWESGERTYGELASRAWQLANALRGKGYERGATVALLSEPRPEYAECYMGLAALGITVATLNMRLHPDELADCLTRVRPSAVIASSEFAHLLDGFQSQFPDVRDWVAFGQVPSYTPYEQLLAGACADEPPRVARGSDIHNILFTSGTTGKPKAACISQRAAAARGERLARWFGLTKEDGCIGWMPLFHCGGDESLYATLLTGGIYAAFAKADAKAMFERIEHDRLTWTLLLPGVLTDFLDHPQRDAHDLSSMRLAIGYANMMPNVVTRLTETLNIDFYDAFGQSETSYLTAHGICRPGEAPSLRKLPTPNMDVRIVDENMNDMPVGQPGECVVRGPSVMSGYLDDDEANAEVFYGGWLHTDDLLQREADGSLTYVDRKKYLIKTGGENVYPAEVETVLCSHAAVQEACVLGIPDDYWGEAVRAVVVLRESGTACSEELIQWCRDHLAGYKCPRALTFMRPEELPRSTTGKLQRHELAKTIGGG